MAKIFDVMVRGGGIVGNCLALLLAQERFRVVLTASAAPSDPSANVLADVRAFALNQASKQLLESLGCWPAGLAVTAVEQMQVFGDGASQVNFSSELAGGTLAWIVEAPAIEKLLQQALAFQPQIQVLHESSQIHQTSARLTVICEGKLSSTRQALGVEYQRTPYAQSALSVRVRCEQLHLQTARQWFSEGDVLALLPMQGAQGSEVSVVWSLTPEKATQLYRTEADSFEAALMSACGSTLGRMQLQSERQLWPLQRAFALNWTGHSEHGAWVLAGDAAHTVHPLAGQGLNLGLADVSELLRVLRDRAYWREIDDPKLLRAYERNRKGNMLLMDRGMDSLQWLFTQRGNRWEQLRALGMRAVDHSTTLKHWLAKQAMNA
jgi:ubiquinone biosynthesis UbiH/UbiF/VisC/COQ6 family hydroxylase